MFDVALSERPARVRETVATLRPAWTGRTVRVPRPHRAGPSGPGPAGRPEDRPRGDVGRPPPGAPRRIADGFIPSEPECWEFYRDECVKLGKPDPGPGITGHGDAVVLRRGPRVAAWPELGPYFLHETNAYGAWQAAAGIGAATYRPMSDVAAVRASGQYRILTPDEYRREMVGAGDLAFAMLHPMVGGIPPAAAWRHLHLFEEAFL